MHSALALDDTTLLAIDMDIAPQDSGVVIPIDTPACLTCRYGIEQMDAGIYCQVFAAITCAADLALPYFKPCNPSMPAQSRRMRHIDDDLGGFPVEKIIDLVDAPVIALSTEILPPAAPVAIDDGNAVQDQAGIDDLFD